MPDTASKLALVDAATDPAIADASSVIKRVGFGQIPSHWIERAAITPGWCRFESRGAIEIKGLGPLETWFLIPETDHRRQA